MQRSRRRWHLGPFGVLTGFAILISAQVFGQSGQPEMVIPSPNHNMGTVWEGETISHTYEVKNEGTAELKILAVKPG